MNFRDMANERIAQWRVRQKKALLMLGIAGAASFALQVTASPGSLVGGAISLLGAALLWYGIFLFVKVYVAARNTLLCPRCGRKLGYLLLDPSYSKSVYAAIRLPDFPAAIHECPYCKLNFDREGQNGIVAE